MQSWSAQSSCTLCWSTPLQLRLPEAQAQEETNCKARCCRKAPGCLDVTAWCNTRTRNYCLSLILSILCFNNHILKECSLQPGWSKHCSVTALQSFSSRLQSDQVMPRAIRQKYSTGYKTAVLFNWHLIGHLTFVYMKAKVVPQIILA